MQSNDIVQPSINSSDSSTEAVMLPTTHEKIIIAGSIDEVKETTSISETIQDEDTEVDVKVIYNQDASFSVVQIVEPELDNFNSVIEVLPKVTTNDLLIYTETNAISGMVEIKPVLEPLQIESIDLPALDIEAEDDNKTSFDNKTGHAELPVIETITVPALLKTLEAPIFEFDEEMTQEISQQLIESSPEIAPAIEQCITEITECLELIADYECIEAGVPDELIDELDMLYKELAIQLKIDIGESMKKERFVKVVDTLLNQIAKDVIQDSMFDRGTHERMHDHSHLVKSATQLFIDQTASLHNWLGRYSIHLATA